MICAEARPYLPSCSDEKWRVVPIEKTFADRVDPNETEKKVKEYLLNTQTQIGRFWRYGSTCHFREIGFNVIIGYPIWGICSVAFHILRMPHDVIKGVVIAFAKICDDYNEYSKSGSVPLSVLLTFASFVKRLTFDIVVAICEDLLSAIKDPFYTVALTLIGVYMLFCPYEGRSLLDIVERHWRGGVPVQQDIREVSCNSCSIQGLFEYYQSVNVVYLAWCCQSRGDLILGQAHNKVVYPTLRLAEWCKHSQRWYAAESEEGFKKREALYLETAEILNRTIFKDFPHLQAPLCPPAF